MFRAATTLFLFAFASGSNSIQQQSVEPETDQATSGPNAADFYLELLDPNPRSTSSAFNDYYPEGSYHVNKLDFWRDFPKFADAAGRDFRALIILGPVGPLWSYYVFAFLGSGDNRVIVNEVVFPHARLTYKATGVVSEARTRELLTTLASLESVKPVQSPEALSEMLSELEKAEAGYSLGDFWFDLLIVDGHAQGGAYIGGTLISGYHPAALTEELNSLTKQLEATYQHGNRTPK